MRKHLPSLLAAILSILAFVALYALLSLIFPTPVLAYHIGLFSLILFLMLEEILANKAGGPD